MGGGWVPHLLVVASELSTTTMSPVVCRGDGSVGNNQKISVLLLRFLRATSGTCSPLTKQLLRQVGNKKPVPKRHRLGDGGLQSLHTFDELHTSLRST